MGQNFNIRSLSDLFALKLFSEIFSSLLIASNIPFDGK